MSVDEDAPAIRGLFDYQPIVERQPLLWPGGARLAFYVGLNVEYYPFGGPGLPLLPSPAERFPDPLNEGWRDYGPRVGIWRMMELYDELGIRPSALLNAEVGEHYPQIIRAGVERDWCWLAHGKNNTVIQSSLEPGDERQYLQEMTQMIRAGTGTAPRGWLGPALSESDQTVTLLAELGYSYVLDWTNDDQPYRLNVDGMISVPYSIEINDITLCVDRKLTGPDMERVIIDQAEQLLEDGHRAGRVMALALHPFISGQPFRHRYIARALRHICALEGVWVTTADDIASHYREMAGMA